MKKIILLIIIVITVVSVYFFNDIQDMLTKVNSSNIKSSPFTKSPVDSSSITKVSNEIHINLLDDYNIISSKIIKTDDNGYCVLANLSYKGMNFSFLVIKFSKDQKFEWGNIYNANGESSAFIIKSDQDGLLLAGEHYIKGSLLNAFVLKIDFKGDIIWEQNFGEQQIKNKIRDIIATDDGYIAVGEHIKGFLITIKNNMSFIKKVEEALKSIWIVTFDKKGNFLNKNLLETDKYTFGVKIIPNDNNYIIYTIPTSSPKEIHINPNGKVLSSKDITKLPSDLERKYNKDAKKIYYKTIVVDKSSKEKFIIEKMTDTKTVAWKYEIKKTDNYDSIKIEETQDGGCIINNFKYAFFEGSTLLIRLDKEGKEQWRKHYHSQDGRFAINSNIKFNSNKFIFLSIKKFTQSSTINTKVNDKSIQSKVSIGKVKTKLILIEIDE